MKQVEVPEFLHYLPNNFNLNDKALGERKHLIVL